MLKKTRILREILKHDLVQQECKNNNLIVPKHVDDAIKSDNLLLFTIGTIIDQVDKGTFTSSSIDTLIMKNINIKG